MTAFAYTGFFVLATHKSLKVTTWTRIRDTIKELLLYGSFNWRRASDGLNPPKLSPKDRKLAAPARNPELVKPRENALNAVIKAQPKKVTPKKWDITAGAIVSDPLMPEEGPQTPFAKRLRPEPETAMEPSEAHEESAEHAGHEESELVREEVASSDEGVVIVRRRKRHRHQGLTPRRAPRTAVQYVGNKPGLLARWFGQR